MEYAEIKTTGDDGSQNKPAIDHKVCYTTMCSNTDQVGKFNKELKEINIWFNIILCIHAVTCTKYYK